MQQRKNIRLLGYDYSGTGLYFLTIVVQNRLHLFGRIRNREMVLNDAGRMIAKWYREIENKYPDKRCREMVVMPNHFHCIIENLEMNTGGVESMDVQITDTETGIHVRPMFGQIDGETDAHVGVPLRGRPETNEKYGIHNQKYGATVGDVMDWFKTMTTNEYIRGVKNNGWKRYDGKLWQRNYYDHIIRDSKENILISSYIIENPAKWCNDKFYEGDLSTE